MRQMVLLLNMIIDFIRLYKKIELIIAPERKGTWHLGQGRDP